MCPISGDSAWFKEAVSTFKVSKDVSLDVAHILDILAGTPPKVQWLLGPGIVAKPLEISPSPPHHGDCMAWERKLKCDWPHGFWPCTLEPHELGQERESSPKA